MKSIAMHPNAVSRLACMLTWAVSLPSILGFHLITNSPRGRHQVYFSSGSVTPRHSSFHINQSTTRSFELKGIWGSSQSSSSSSSSSEDDSNDDEEMVTEMGKTPVDESLVETKPSMPSADASSEDDVAVKSSTAASEKSLWVLLNEIGNNFRGLAQKSAAKGYESEEQSKKMVFAAKACIYYTLFIIYRVYRGFFVLLPATFREVYQKLEKAMNTENLSMEETGFTGNGDDLTSNSTRWRTKITVSILTSVVTISYVVGGTLKMASKFFRTIAKTSDVPKSFGAAADEVLNFEGRINRVGKVNGEEGADKSGLAP